MKCTYCSNKVSSLDYTKHLRMSHNDCYDGLNETILVLNNLGISINEIAEELNLSSKLISDSLNFLMETEAEYKITKPMNITEFGPKNFKLEATTVWNFKDRGKWATHDGKYRGNWSPYIPRNLILRYSKEGDIVLDPFLGSGNKIIKKKRNWD